MHGFEVLVALAPLAMVVLIIAIPAYLRSRDRGEMQKTLRAAIDKGQELPAELVEAMSRDGKQPPSPARDIRHGIVWLAVGLGIGAFAYFISMEEADALYPLMGFASIPVMIGLALIALGAFGVGKSKS